jgi:hypothetical protein
MSDPFGKEDLKGFLQFRSEHTGRFGTDLVMKYATQVRKKAWAHALLSEQKLLSKLPKSWFDKGFFCPTTKAAEQCSSWATAQWKARLAEGYSVVHDLTGGLGIDSLAFSHRVKKVHYREPEAELCTRAERNFRRLGRSQIECANEAAESFLEQAFHSGELVYIDPDRRVGFGGQRSSLSRMQPDWAFIYQLMGKGWPLLLKLSPLQDLTDLIQSTSGKRTICVLESKGECKEVLLFCQNAGAQAENVSIVLADVQQKWSTQKLHVDELNTSCWEYGWSHTGFLLDPSPAFRKAKAWTFLEEKYKLRKIAPQTHLFHSEHSIPGFPGRQFRIRSALDKSRLPGAASVISRNHFESAAQLRKKWKLKESEKVFLVAFRDEVGKGVVLACEKSIH